jgi:hypothetical protein
MAKNSVPAAPSKSDIASKISSAILSFIANTPTSLQRTNSSPGASARNIANKAAATAATVAGTLALPAGPLGWITILPEMVGVWKIQAQMVADIAALYGKTATLAREQMLYCLFKHSAAQVMRDLVVRVGERVIIKRASLRVMRSIAQKIGVKVTQRAIGKGLSRWLPIVGALGVGAYAFYDTAQVASTAMELFSQDIGPATSPQEAASPVKKPRKRVRAIS